MKSSKAQILTKIHKIPEIQFEDQQLTSFSGIILFQLLFKNLNLKNKLKKYFNHLKVTPIFGHHLIVLLLFVYLILGFKRLREIKFYKDDPMVLRLMGLKKLPNVSTISRSLGQLDDKSVKNVQNVSRSFVINGLHREQFSRVLFPFIASEVFFPHTFGLNINVFNHHHHDKHKAGYHNGF